MKRTIKRILEIGATVFSLLILFLIFLSFFHPSHEEQVATVRSELADMASKDPVVHYQVSQAKILAMKFQLDNSRAGRCWDYFESHPDEQQSAVVGPFQTHPYADFVTLRSRLVDQLDHMSKGETFNSREEGAEVLTGWQMEFTALNNWMDNTGEGGFLVTRCTE